MRSKIFVASAIVLFGLAAFAAGYSTGQENKGSTRVYELRTYTALPGRLPALNKRFAEHNGVDWQGTLTAFFDSGTGRVEASLDDPRLLRLANGAGRHAAGWQRPVLRALHDRIDIAVIPHVDCP